MEHLQSQKHTRVGVADHTEPERWSLTNWRNAHVKKRNMSMITLHVEENLPSGCRATFIAFFPSLRGGENVGTLTPRNPRWIIVEGTARERVGVHTSARGGTGGRAAYPFLLCSCLITLRRRRTCSQPWRRGQHTGTSATVDRRGVRNDRRGGERLRLRRRAPPRIVGVSRASTHLVEPLRLLEEVFHLGVLVQEGRVRLVFLLLAAPSAISGSACEAALAVLCNLPHALQAGTVAGRVAICSGSGRKAERFVA